MPPAKFLKWLILLIASLFYLFEFVARVEPSLASKGIADYFNLSNGEFGTLASLFFWVYAPMQLVVGLMLDRFGARRLVPPAILVCSTGVIIFGTATSPAMAGIGRMATGLGASFAFVGALYVVNHWFRPERFALLSGLVNAIGMLGTAIGAVMLTSAISANGWQHVLVSTGIAGSILFIIALIFIRDAPVAHTDDKQPIGFLTPLAAIIKDGRIWLIAIIGMLYYMPVNVFGSLWGSAELSADHSLNPFQAETAVSSIFLGLAAGSVFSGWLSDHLGHRKWIIVIGAFLTAISFTLAIYIASESVALLSVLLFISGFFGSGQMLAFSIAKESHPAAYFGTIIAFTNMIGIGGALVFQPLVGEIIDYSEGQFGLAMLTIPASLLAAGLLAILLKEFRHPDHIS